MSKETDTSATPVVALDGITVGVDPDDLSAGVIVDGDGRVVAEGVDVRLDTDGTLVSEDEDTDEDTTTQAVSDGHDERTVSDEHRIWTDTDSDE